jgi:hypothetical protein
MTLLANTVLLHNNERMGYEIFRMQDTLLFKPYYTYELNFPCIILNRVNSSWWFEETVGENIKCQVLEDIQCLKNNHRTAPLVN